MASQKVQAERVQSLSDGMRLRPVQKLAAMARIASAINAGKTPEEAASTLKRSRNVAGFDWSKIDLAKIVEFVKAIVALLGLFA